MELEQDLDALPRRQASIQHHAEQKQMARQTLRLLLVHIPGDNRTATSMPMSSTHERLTSRVVDAGNGTLAAVLYSLQRHCEYGAHVPAHTCESGLHAAPGGAQPG